MAGLMKGKVINMAQPVYPLEAKRSHIAGSVIFKITVDEAGQVSAVKTLCGPPLLVKSAESSIRQTQMEATIVAGKPVKITGIIIYNFTLQ
jgi:TonB family protein